MLLRVLLTTLVSSAALGSLTAGEIAPIAAEEVYLQLDYASDTGAQGDGLTKYAAPTVSGWAPRDALVEVIKDGKVIAKSKAPADPWGRWQAQMPKLSEGTYVLQARAKADGRGYLSKSFPLSIDLTDPAPPKLRVVKGYALDGVSPYRELPVEGTSEKKAYRIELTTDQGTTIFPMPRRDGSWKAKVRLSPGDRTLTAVAYDEAGNRSKRSKPLKVQIIKLRDSVDLGRLDGKDGTALWVQGFDGACFEDGRQVAATDFDGDGLGDVLIGGNWLETSGENGEVRATLFGATGSKGGWKPKVDVPALTSGAGFRVFAGKGNLSEWAPVASAGDVNRDGLGDFAILAEGYLAIVYGRQGGFESAPNLAKLEPRDGFRLLGFSRYSGPAQPIGEIGDFNGDGIDDVLVRDRRTLYVVFGQRGRTRGDVALTEIGREDGIKVELPGAYTNASAAGGDLDGDGLSDLVVGVGGTTGPGSISVVFGDEKLQGTVKLIPHAKTKGVYIPGVSEELEWLSVASGFDLNGDGRSDLVALTDRGSASIARKAGKGIVLYGASRDRLRAITNTGRLPPDAGFRLVGDHSSWLQSAAAADVNGDRLDDLILGAANSGEDVGYVVYGRRERPAETLDPAELDGVYGYRLTVSGRRPSIDAPGCTVASAGDFNGDGIDDILVSGKSERRIDQPGAAAYVVFGRRE